MLVSAGRRSPEKSLRSVAGTEAMTCSVVAVLTVRPTRLSEHGPTTPELLPSCSVKRTFVTTARCGRLTAQRKVVCA
jgi:hypothetical protein